MNAKSPTIQSCNLESRKTDDMLDVNLAGGSQPARRKPLDAIFGEGKSVRIRRGRAAVMDICAAVHMPLFQVMTWDGKAHETEVLSQKTGPQG
jgi:hypothetical protein